ncbi:CTL-like protein 1 [Asbolus verrucosus]|uniref:Choline transporter-like protein n=1 Tax=Asbolus verrucosus TaxID=1661398 RepID=A0A482V878_ASBVE|nr:CTL-like protein 1 [Asbolus verrucosus]
MGCCDSKKKPEREENVERGCTDVFWLCLYIAFLLLMVLIAAFSFVYGNPIRIINGYDSFGNTCGTKHNKQMGNLELSGLDTSDKPYLLFYDIKELKQSLKICVKECPKETLIKVEDINTYYAKTGINLCRYDFNYDDFKNVSITNKNILSSYLGPCPALPIYESYFISYNINFTLNGSFGGLYYNDFIHNYQYFGNSFFVVIILIIVIVMRKQLCLATAYYPGTSGITSRFYNESQLTTPVSHTEPVAKKGDISLTEKILEKMTVVEYTDPSWVKYMWWVYFIGLIWTCEFIMGCQQMVIAGAVAHWFYRHKYKDNSHVSYAICKLIKYHLGSAFQVLSSHALQVATINGLGDFILFLGKCFVTAVTGCVGLFLFRKNPELEFYAAPTLIMVLDTIYLCICQNGDSVEGIQMENLGVTNVSNLNAQPNELEPIK